MKLYKKRSTEFGLRTLNNKLLAVLGDMYCFAWDVIKGECSTREEKREADEVALKRMAFSAMQADALIAEMEARGYGIPEVA